MRYEVARGLKMYKSGVKLGSIARQSHQYGSSKKLS